MEMTDKAKQVLLEDLCLRLKYRPKIQIWFEDMSGSGYFTEELTSVEVDSPYVNDRWIDNVRPFLRSLSTMTEEEKNELALLAGKNECDEKGIHLTGYEYGYHIHYSFTTRVTKFLLSKHFDINGLIPMGLAIEAPKEMYLKTESLT